MKHLVMAGSILLAAAPGEAIPTMADVPGAHASQRSRSSGTGTSWRSTTSPSSQAWVSPAGKLPDVSASGMPLMWARSWWTLQSGQAGTRASSASGSSERTRSVTRRRVTW